MAADTALEALREDASYAHAQHGAVYQASLMHYHQTLLPLLTQAFDEVLQANDLSLSKRDRFALHAHAVDIATHVCEDVDAVRDRYRLVLERRVVAGPGARAVLEAAVSRGVMQAEAWWDGRIRLGTLTTPPIAQKPWQSYRPLPRWIPWAAGAGALSATAAPILLILL